MPISHCWHVVDVTFHVSYEIFQLSMLIDVAVVKEEDVFRSGYACMSPSWACHRKLLSTARPIDDV